MIVPYARDEIVNKSGKSLEKDSQVGPVRTSTRSCSMVK